MTALVFESGDGLTAALICEDPLYALGPVIQGDNPGEAAEALRAFVQGLDVPADEQPTIALMVQWQSFVMALAEMQLEASQAAQQAAQAPPDAIPGQTTVDEQPAANGPQDAPEPWSEDHATAAEAAAAGDQSAAEAIAHSEAPAPVLSDPGQQACWQCGGGGQVNLAGDLHQCNVCGGTGVVAAVTP